MNERIKELMDQAGIDVEAVENLGEMPTALKFAELIVKKFDDILVLEQLDCVGNEDKPAAKRVERLREKVKTYFGVEE